MLLGVLGDPIRMRIPSALVAARSSVLVISSQSFRWTR
jgi:hypothetical protein